MTQVYQRLNVSNSNIIGQISELGSFGIDELEEMARDALRPGKQAGLRANTAGFYEPELEPEPYPESAPAQPMGPAKPYQPTPVNIRLVMTGALSEGVPETSATYDICKQALISVHKPYLGVAEENQLAVARVKRFQPATGLETGPKPIADSPLPQGGTYVDVKGDGNCLFHAIYAAIDIAQGERVLYDYGDSAVDLRKAVAGVEAPPERIHMINTFHLDTAPHEKHIWETLKEVLDGTGLTNITLPEIYEIYFRQRWYDDDLSNEMVWIYAGAKELVELPKIINRKINVYSQGVWHSYEEGIVGGGIGVEPLPQIYIAHLGNHYNAVLPR